MSKVLHRDQILNFDGLEPCGNVYAKIRNFRQIIWQILGRNFARQL